RQEAEGNHHSLTHGFVPIDEYGSRPSDAQPPPGGRSAAGADRTFVWGLSARQAAALSYFARKARSDGSRYSLPELTGSGSRRCAEALRCLNASAQRREPL